MSTESVSPEANANERGAVDGLALMVVEHPHCGMEQVPQVDERRDEDDQ